MRRFYRAGVVLLTVVVLMGCVSCGTEKSPYEHLETFSTLYPLPAGRMYDSTADQSQDTYLDPAVFTLLYGRETAGDDREDIRRFALFLGTSSTHVYEMGIFECYDRDGANEVLGLVETRLSLLASSNTTADITATQSAQVRLFGKTVVYVVLPDNAKAMRVLERQLR